jgi:hypothetical protein
VNDPAYPPSFEACSSSVTVIWIGETASIKKAPPAWPAGPSLVGSGTSTPRAGNLAALMIAAVPIWGLTVGLKFNREAPAVKREAEERHKAGGKNRWRLRRKTEKSSRSRGESHEALFTNGNYRQTGKHRRAALVG